ncbi:MAG: biotin--[acetyl-CoA-carboxylase] ligase [Nitrospirae bacterium]|nr:biotin--[acetyl-CoA-carboxylase] ligase [Nitrospirota bacterium]
MEKAVGNNLLKLLKEREGTFVSGEAMSKALGITRAGIWKRIKAMKQKGYVINSSPSKGYKLLRSPDILTADEITGVFQGKLLGKKVLFFESTTSTNDIAMEMGQKGSPEGTIVVADAQEKGKGRLGRTWISPPGVNLYFTLLLRPPFPPKDATLLTLMAAVSIVSAIRKYTGLKATIKWPNDILIGDKKVGGVLTEMKSDMDRISFVALGMGINVNLDLNTLP